MNKCKTELQFWRSKSPAIPSVCSSCNQKIAPVLPPEDLQALLNQGVDPENIIINDEADTDAAVDVDVDEDLDANGVIGNANGMVDKQFASPDESTTAKLLAVNSAAKNQKRKYAATMDADGSAATSNAIASNVTPSNVNITATTTTTTSATGTSSGNANSGYSTKLFYGNHQRSGVIVSPVSMKLAIDSGNGNGNRLTNLQQMSAVEASVSPAGAAPVGASDIAEQVESKKARRVQKANRCVNSAHGKRSK